MSYLFFEGVLEELGKKLNYEAVVNYAGNSFCKDSGKLIQEAFPMGSGKPTGVSAVAAFFENATVVVNQKDIDPSELGPDR